MQCNGTLKCNGAEMNEPAAGIGRRRFIVYLPLLLLRVVGEMRRVGVGLFYIVLLWGRVLRCG